MPEQYITFPKFPAMSRALADVRLMYGLTDYPTRFTKEELEIASRFDAALELRKAKERREAMMKEQAVKDFDLDDFIEQQKQLSEYNKNNPDNPLKF
jgi:hypothetical protein